MVILLFATYEVYGKALQANSKQGELAQDLDRDWSQNAPGPTGAGDKPLPGKGVARLYIPRLNKQWVVVEGVTPKDIKLAPGHYPESQMPGQIGNFAVAGHRLPAIFWDVDKLEPDNTETDNTEPDTIVVETRTTWYVYIVTKVFVIRPTKVSVVAANPDNPTAAPTRKLFTLTTCNPKWDNYQRLIVHAELSREQPKNGQRPPEIAGV